MDVDVDPANRTVRTRQVVTWTNTTQSSTDRMVFQVPPHFRLSKDMIEAGERTVESLRLDPADCIDYTGNRFRLLHCLFEGRSATSVFSEDDASHLTVQLGRLVAPAETVSVELQFVVSIPPIMGRLGQFQAVTNLLNWYPVVAVCDDDGWKPVPYVPWHQPWHNEVGDYDVRLTLPADHKFVSGGHVVNEQSHADRRVTYQIQGRSLRDFVIIASPRFRELTGRSGSTPIRILYLPGHEEHAENVLQTAEETLQIYTDWFGAYPYKEFELTESYFGWNGNESSGVVMIDARIFDTPAYTKRYVDHLASHEICHQWWYSAVGTDGYREPWMDEGLVTWFTRIRMEDKYGPAAEVLDFPGYGVFQFPNIEYRTLVHSQYQLYRDRGGEGVPLGSLEEMGHLHNLFSLVYDRGARVTGMIQQVMGRERFFAFMKQLYGRYRFKILRVVDYQRELEEFTGEDWGPFFDRWLRGTDDGDWALDDVQVEEADVGYQTTVRVSRSDAQMPAAPIEARFSDAAPFRLSSLSEASARDDVVVRQTSPNDWLVSFRSQQKPQQVIIDPDRTLIESDPGNNHWRPEISVRLSPIYTPVDEAALLQPWNESAIVGGFGVDGDGRFGLRASLVAGNRYRVSPFLAYTAATASRNDDHLSAGIDAIVYNAPAANWQLLARYEYALLSTLANDPGHQARFAVRRIINYTTSLVYPNLSYVDLYARFGDNFFPDEDNTPSLDPRVEQYGNVRAFGIEYHADSQMPYWNPDRGFKVDANYEHGFQAFGGGSTYDRVSGQASVVQRLSGLDGWLGQTRLAGRIAGGYGWQDNGEHFRFGGPGRFRGRNATETEGNAFWLSSLEWRFPIAGDIDYEVLDNTAALNDIDGALFYDVGRSYLFNEPQGDIDQAIGAGLYFQLPILSFVERLTVRVEYGYSVVNDTGAFWFGLYRAF